MKRPIYSVLSIVFLLYLTWPVLALSEDVPNNLNMDKTGKGLVFGMLNTGIASSSIQGYNTPFVLEPLSLQYNFNDYFGFIVRNRIYEDFKTLHSPTVSISVNGYSYGLHMQYHVNSYFIPFLRIEQLNWDMKARALDHTLGKISGSSPMYSLGMLLMFGSSGLGVSLQHTRVYKLSDTTTTENTLGFIYHF